MDKQPPKWALWFLKKTCSDQFLDELEGDLYELYYRDIAQYGIHRARKKFIWKALWSPRWYRLPSFRHFQNQAMFKNHFKVAARHTFRYSLVSFIQFAGLLLGLVAAFYIGLFVKNELAYDQMHEKADNLFRVLRYDPITGERGQSTASLHGATLKEEFPFINICRFGNDPVKIGDRAPLFVEDFYWADSTFFQLFTFPFEHGDPRTCLSKVNSLVLTKTKSEQLFGTENPIGKTIQVKVYDGNQEYMMTITGVVKDPPKHSHIQFEALGSMANAESLYSSLITQWGFSWLRTYIEVPVNRIAEVQAGIPNLISKYMNENDNPRFGMTFQPFDKVYLHSQDIPKNTFGGSIRNLKIFASIGLLILLISLMNYINLATARAYTRSREVGIRKFLGSLKSHLIIQFILESVLFTFVCGVLAAMFLALALPHLNKLLDLDLSIHLLFWQDGLMVIGGLVGLGILAGILPSLTMIRLPSLSNNTSNFQFKSGHSSFSRRLFIGLQYVVTLVLLVSTLVVYKQYLYLQNFDKGFDSDQLLHISVDDRNLQKQIDILKDRVGQLAGVSGITATGEDLPSVLNNTWGLEWNGSNLEKPQGIDIVAVDKDYFPLLEIPFLEGNNFSNDFDIDSARSVIINEKALSIIGKEDIIGQEIIIGGRNRKVIGVVGNHHNTTLHSQIVPIAYFIFPSGFRVSPDNLMVRLETQNINSFLDDLEKIWKEFSPDPISYNFVDDAFAAAYHSERRFSTLIGSFTLLAIIISIVGIFGLIHFVAQIKLREISIRRILGANSFSLMRLLGKDFIAIFAISIIIALPIAWHYMNSWLSNYAYHIKVNAELLLMAAFVCIGITSLVIFYHLHKATRVNPAEILASE